MRLCLSAAVGSLSGPQAIMREMCLCIIDAMTILTAEIRISKAGVPEGWETSDGDARSPGSVPEKPRLTTMACIDPHSFAGRFSLTSAVHDGHVEGRNTRIGDGEQSGGRGNA